MGDVFGEEMEYIIDEVGKDDLSSVYFLQNLESKLQTLRANEKLKDMPFKFIGEVQYLHTDYLEMRKKSHLYYKIYRTHEQDLQNLEAQQVIIMDFFKYATALTANDKEAALETSFRP